MLIITSIIFAIAQVAGSDTVLIKDVRPVYVYANDKRTDELEGYKYVVVAPDNKYEEFIIKVNQAKPIITVEELAVKGGLAKAKVKGFEGKFYRTRSGDYAFTSTAAGLELVNA